MPILINMSKIVEIVLKPSDAFDENKIKTKAAQSLGIDLANIKDSRVIRRSIDARKKPVYRLRVEIYTEAPFEAEPPILEGFKSVENAARVIIIGAGPAGYFAALELIELGLKPIILERGKDVRARRRDLRAIQQFGEVNPHSNYCFGEGGAGTYSDGKLYTRSQKRGKIKKALQLLVEHGANSDILVDAHPHIGSNKLPKIVANIRETIIQYGGEIHFDSFVTDFIFQKGKMLGAIVNDKEEFLGEALVLATGHSARDIFYKLNEHNIHIEFKAFALGVRVEHPQPLIDQIQYRQKQREDNLPASSYSLVCQVKNRGVFSFCMCPGGLIVPASTAPGELVVNGMSMSKRDSPFANSGTVVAVEAEDLIGFKKHGIFAGLEFQRAVEQRFFQAGNGSQQAAAQRMPDFVKGKISASLSDTSYIPGIFGAPVHELLPKSISRRLKEGMLQFGKKMKGYYTSEAQIIGTESRTSSPIRIPRNKDTLMHDQMEGLFPCGEGAGYAGGILSAAMDGQNVAKAIKKFLKSV